MKKIISFLAIFVLIFIPSTFADTITYDFSVHDGRGDLAGSDSYAIYNELGNYLDTYINVSGEYMLGGESANNDATTPFSFENNLEGYTGDLNALTEFTLSIEFDMLTHTSTKDVYFSIFDGQYYNSPYWTYNNIYYNAVEDRLTFSTFLEHFPPSVIHVSPNFLGGVYEDIVISQYINVNTNEYTITYSALDGTYEFVDSWNYTDFFQNDSSFTLTDMYLYEYKADVLRISNFTLTSDELILSTPAEPVEEPSISDVTKDLPQVGEDVGGFLGNVGPGLVQFLFTLGIASGVLGLIVAIIFVVKKMTAHFSKRK